MTMVVDMNKKTRTPGTLWAALEARIKSLEALVDELRRERDALMTERDRLSAAYESMRDKRDACVREAMEKATRMRVMR